MQEDTYGSGRHVQPPLVGRVSTAAASASAADQSITVTVELPPELIADFFESPAFVEEVARRVAELEPPSIAPEWPAWLTVDEAADYLRCNKRRIYDLTSQGRLTPMKDGRRSLYERAELDRHLNRDGYEVAKNRRRARAVLVDQSWIGLLGRLGCSSLVAMRVRRSAG